MSCRLKITAITPPLNKAEMDEVATVSNLINTFFVKLDGEARSKGVTSGTSY